MRAQHLAGLRIIAAEDQDRREQSPCLHGSNLRNPAGRFSGLPCFVTVMSGLEKCNSQVALSCCCDTHDVHSLWHEETQMELRVVQVELVPFFLGEIAEYRVLRTVWFVFEAGDCGAELGEALFR